MAESDQMATKRMRLSSSSVQTPTIARSQNQIHSDRSGRVLYAASRAGKRLPSEKFGEKAPPRVYPRITIKDLRFKRVFPPASISIDWELHGKGENQSKEQDRQSLRYSGNPNGIEIVGKEGSKHNVERLGDSGEDREASELALTTPPVTEQFSCGTVSTQEINGSLVNSFSEKKSDTNLRTKSGFNSCSRAKIFKNPGSFSYRRLLPYLMEAADDTTLSGRSSKPSKSLDQVHLNINSQSNVANEKSKVASTQDPKEVVGKSMTVNIQYDETEHVLQSADSVSNNPSDRRSHGSTSPLRKTTELGPNKKSVCSKRKLFRTPGSVNYRRLLPYLKDNPIDSSRVPNCGNHPSTQKKTEENALSVLAVSENKEVQGMVTLDVTREQCSSDDTGSQPPEHVSESADLSDPDKEQETQVKHVILDAEKHLDIPCEVISSETPLPSLPHSRCSSDVAASVLSHTPVDTSDEAKSSDTEMRNGAEKLEAENNAEQADAKGLNSKALLLEASVVSSGTPSTASPSKGILKRNLRGCRGLCACLNCSSFRLHAERAFEFSRNQLQDTEEMVLDLVGEISYLRDMLEKHASADHAESYTTQVKEACRRASEAAEAAKSHLHQMKDDLQVHCRVPTEQRARVRFAHYDQEMKIPNGSN